MKTQPSLLNSKQLPNGAEKLQCGFFLIGHHFFLKKTTKIDYGIELKSTKIDRQNGQFEPRQDI